jgi:hypothetical protein
MAVETRVALKEKLYTLLRVKKGYMDAGVEILPVLVEAIEYAKAPMDAEDIAHIEKQVFSQ